MPPRLRRATLDDLDTLVLHRRLMWADMGTYPEDELPAADAPYRRWLRARLRSGACVAWVADARGRAAASGVVWVQPVQPRPGWAAGTQPYLLSVYTAPEARGRGLATRIARATIAWVRAEGYPRLALHASDAGRAIYERLGFAPTNEMRLELTPRRGGRASRAAPPRPRVHRSSGP